jgi:hypothetical protein
MFRQAYRKGNPFGSIETYGVHMKSNNEHKTKEA